MAFAVASLASAQTQVAFDDLGVTDSQPHLHEGTNYTWPAAVPVTDRTIAYGSSVVLGYGSAVPNAGYQVTILLSSDAATRNSLFTVDGMSISQVTVDGQAATTPVVTSPNSQKAVTFSLPASALVDGRFVLSIINTGTASPNAAVSRVTIVSTDPTPLTPIPGGFDPATIQYTPIPVSAAGEGAWSASLNGIWKFSPTAPANFGSPGNTAAWANIQVPGQWRNQGHDLPAAQATAYFRTFEIPAAWQGRRIKLHFGAVFSTCEVYVNGAYLGAHTGGFTPFELDATQLAVIGGTNTLALRVTSSSLADTMASASSYACHPLGGISRDVTLFSVPETHLKDAIVRTDLDEQFQNAILNLTLEAVTPTPTNAVIRLKAADGSTVFQETREISAGSQSFDFPVADPLKWTPETPNLYALEVSFGGAVTHYPVGFREVNLVGRELRVNGKSVRLRGVNRHEVDPLRGRSLLPGQWETDLLLFKDANVNLIRTCHYPPALDLGVAADQHGMWIEVEGPFCWENLASDASHRTLTIQQLAEMVKAWRNHPSVLFWSVANESEWGTNFSMAADVMQQLDPTRPRTFNWMSSSVRNEDAAKCTIGNIHYPGFTGPGKAAAALRPTYFGEDAHLNAYNRRELITDPNLRDRWAEPFSELWDAIWVQPGALGMSIWAGIDDTFFLDGNLTVGYGAWGPLDGWRRKKPEWYHVRKIYSPIRVRNERSPLVTSQSITLEVENRGDFRNFNELIFHWRNGVQSGTITPNIAARQSGQIVIAPPLGIATGKPVELVVSEPGGREIDRFAFPTGRSSAIRVNAPVPQLVETPSSFVVSQGNVTYTLNRTTGMISWTVDGSASSASGPHLVLTGLNEEGNTQMTGATQYFTPYTRIAAGFALQAVSSAIGADGSITLTVSGNYTEANGTYTYLFRENQPVRLSYSFTMKTALNRRQTGVAFDFPADFNELSWRRNARWTDYPEDHIGRPEGTAQFYYADGKDAIEIGPREQPTAPWSHDNTVYGSNDFRSTKEDIRRARLRSATASFNVFADGDGTHIHAIRLGSVTRASVLNHTNAGYERFLRGMASWHYSNLSVGSQLSGVVEFLPDSANGGNISEVPRTDSSLIGAAQRNGSFEETNVTSPTNIGGGGVPSWQTWTGRSTATNDTGIYDSPVARSQALYIQSGGAVANMTDHLITAGKTFRYGFTDVMAGTRNASMRLVYQNGTTIAEIPGTVISASATDPSLTSYSAEITLPPGDWVGKRLGVGFTLADQSSGFPEIDDVFLMQTETPDRFSEWAGNSGYPTVDRAATGMRDDDRDGASLLMEFVTGGDAAAPDANPIMLEGDAATFVLRDLEAADHIEAGMLFSEDLQNWSQRSGRVTAATDQSGVPAGFTRYLVPLSGPEPRLFMRVEAKVVEP